MSTKVELKVGQVYAGVTGWERKITAIESTHVLYTTKYGIEIGMPKWSFERWASTAELVGKKGDADVQG